MGTRDMDNGLKDFTAEMKAQGLWDSVTLVAVSEFGRTLTENTSNGSDHAWGGNYFIAGGDVQGKKILGSYPNNLSAESPYIFGPGISIPTTPWDSLYYGVAQWFGVTDSNELDEVIPNRHTFPNQLFTKSDLYGGANPPTGPTPV